MYSQIAKWGNSLAIRIPQAIVTKISHLHVGARMEIKAEQGRIILCQDKRYSLQDLVKKITPKNIHRGTFTGKPVGQEIW